MKKIAKILLLCSCVYTTSMDKKSIKREKKRALFQAVKQSNLKKIRELLESGLHPDTKNTKGNTALHIAARYNPNPAIIRLLLEKGAYANDYNEDYQSAIEIISQYEDKTLLQIFIDNGYCSEENDLESAINSCNDFLIKNIVQLGYEISQSNINYLKNYIFLENLGPNDTRDNNKWSFEMIDMLLNRNKHSTVLDGAIVADNLYIVDEIVKSGFDLATEIQDGNAPLLQAALNKSSLDIIKCLIDNGADINQKNKNNGNTALHFAAQRQNEEIIEFLIKSGADRDLKNNNGQNFSNLINRENKRLQDSIQEWSDHYDCRGIGLK